MDTQRRHDLDWLRVLAFLVLIYFHAAIMFIPGGLPLIQNDETSIALDIFVGISSQFRLGLLFLVSGVGVAFAKRRRTNFEFITERSKRLLIPLIFGILIIIPPMIYLEKVFMGDFIGSYFNFYPKFFTQGTYPKGNLSWHHFWFIVYLYLFCLLGLRLFPHMDGSNLSVSRGIAKMSQGYWLYLPIVPLTLVEIGLRATFPGFRDLIHDWASFSHWFLLFMIGFAVANHLVVLDRIMRLRWISLGGAITTTALLFYFFEAIAFNVPRTDPNVVAKYLTYCTLSMSMAWFSLMACVGLAGRYLRFSNRVLTYINEAVYPLFILHLTIITALGYWVVSLNIGIWTKYFFVTTATIVLVLIFYHFLIKPFNSVRLLFGVKPKTKT